MTSADATTSLAIKICDQEERFCSSAIYQKCRRSRSPQPTIRQAAVLRFGPTMIAASATILSTPVLLLSQGYALARREPHSEAV